MGGRVKAAASIGRRRLTRPVALAAAVWLLLAGTAPGSAGTAAVQFDPPSASGRLGEPISYRTTLRAATEPERVELVTRVGDEVPIVRSAALTANADGTFEATSLDSDHVSPNSTFEYWFRAVTDTGSVDGPASTFTLADERFAWRTMAGDTVTLHWYEGDDAFARRALDIGEAAIDQAASLLGVDEVAPVDFFVYASEEPFRDALGPGTRENVGGQANAAIRTMFGLIEPSEIGSDWVDTLVAHELTHLVFADATSNPYRNPPRWLNEGLAVYLSEGYSNADRRRVEDAARTGELFPLESLGGLFPSTRNGFSLAYSESVSGVDWFISRYGKETLVSLIRSYADGLTDDEAFEAATGADFRAFDDAWIAAQGGQRTEPYGPQPAAPGPVPEEWLTAAAGP
jgi:hypothetical protein